MSIARANGDSTANATVQGHRNLSPSCSGPRLVKLTHNRRGSSVSARAVGSLISGTLRTSREGSDVVFDTNVFVAPKIVDSNCKVKAISKDSFVGAPSDKKQSIRNASKPDSFAGTPRDKKQSIRNASKPDRFGASSDRGRDMTLAASKNKREHPADAKAFAALLQKQRMKMPSIFCELEKHKVKRSCWAWYVFPTDKAGRCDPVGTYVTRATAPSLFTSDAAAMWQQVLELLCDLIEQQGTCVLPKIDHGRVHWFIKYWSALDASPEWMAHVCKRLTKFDWPP